jgi:uroporphyrinogen-III synthase
MRKFTVLSTKKLLPSFIEEGSRNGIEIIEQEAIAIHPIRSKEKGDEIRTALAETGEQVVVFTSANAVDSVKEYLHLDGKQLMPQWKVYCIWGKTKEALLPLVQEEQIIATAAYGGDLAKKILEHDVEEIIFFCGNKRRDELPRILKDAGIKVHEIVVYETEETPVMTTGKIDAILFFSPSAVQSFFAVNQPKKDTVCFAIGNTTADAIKEFGTNKIIVSKETSQVAMLQQVTDYFKNTIHH